jgi:hypothetical protein
MEALVTQILNYFIWIKIFTNDNGSCPTKTHLYKNSSNLLTLLYGTTDVVFRNGNLLDFRSENILITDIKIT